MNCDDVFDVLADAPHADSAELAAHLRQCPRCRDLYEALMVTNGHGRTYLDSSPWRSEESGAVSPEAVQVAQTAALRLRQGAAVRRARTVALQAPWSWRYVGAFMAGAVASLALAAAVPATTSHSASQSTVCLWNNRDVASVDASDVVKTCVACHLAAAH